MGHNLCSLRRKSTAHDGTLTRNNDLAADILDMCLEIKPKEFDRAMWTIYRSTRTGSPLVFLSLPSVGCHDVKTGVLTSRSFFIMEVWHCSQLTE